MGFRGGFLCYEICILPTTQAHHLLSTHMSPSTLTQSPSLWHHRITIRVHSSGCISHVGGKSSAVAKTWEPPACPEAEDRWRHGACVRWDTPWPEERVRHCPLQWPVSGFSRDVSHVGSWTVSVWLLNGWTHAVHASNTVNPVSLWHTVHNHPLDTLRTNTESQLQSLTGRLW